jgi:hypothetical protein
MVWSIQVNDISRQLINEAAGKLQDIGAISEANEVIRLLAKYEGTFYKPWLDECLIEQMVKLLYPPDPKWTDEIKARHFRHLKLALTISHEALNEDVRRLFKMQNENNPALDNPV